MKRPGGEPTEVQPFDSSVLKGKVWLESFFFTACPGPCLRMNARLQEIQQALNETVANIKRVAEGGDTEDRDANPDEVVDEDRDT